MDTFESVSGAAINVQGDKTSLPSIKPSVGLDEVLAARAQDCDSVFDSQSAAADREVELISGFMHNLTSVGGPTVADRSLPPLLTPRPFSYRSSCTPSCQSVQSVRSRHPVYSQVRDPMFDFMSKFSKSLMDDATRWEAEARADAARRENEIRNA